MTERKHKPIDPETKALVKEMTEIEDLVANFGLKLTGYDPGITALDKKNMHLNFGKHEWEWLRPLLRRFRALEKEVSFDSKNK